MNSRLIGLDDIADSTVSLGRPWRPSSQTQPMTPAVTYVNCYMGDHITTKRMGRYGRFISSNS